MNAIDDNTTTIAIIKQRLQRALNPSELDIFDDSDAHIGHSGAKNGAGHFLLTIKSDALNSLSRVAQHQRIYAELDDLIPKKIHALGITIK